MRARAGFVAARPAAPAKARPANLGGHASASALGARTVDLGPDPGRRFAATSPFFTTALVQPSKSLLSSRGSLCAPTACFLCHPLVLHERLVRLIIQAHGPMPHPPSGNDLGFGCRVGRTFQKLLVDPAVAADASFKFVRDA